MGTGQYTLELECLSGDCAKKPFPETCGSFTKAKAVAKFPPDEDKVEIGTYSVRYQTRKCNELTGCSAWGQPTVWSDGKVFLEVSYDNTDIELSFYDDGEHGICKRTYRNLSLSLTKENVIGNIAYMTNSFKRYPCGYRWCTECSYNTLIFASALKVSDCSTEITFLTDKDQTLLILTASY